MKLNRTILPVLVLAVCFGSCVNNSNSQVLEVTNAELKPFYITDTLEHDTDDPAIWIHPSDPSRSLIVGTDKDENGGLFVFDLRGKLDSNRSVKGLKRPNNVDIEYGLQMGDTLIDIAVATERLTHQLRIFRIPDMLPLDGGGIPVFVGETGTEFRDLMGISLFKNKAGVIYAIVGRKNGPTDSSYLWQYQLSGTKEGRVQATLVRKFGAYSGLNEIESIAVDDQLGYVYYSDEGIGVRKYYADPEKGNQELALFGTGKFKEDNEGISIYNRTDSTGFILVSDQQDHSFHIYPREGTIENKHSHPLIRKQYVAARESDGSEIISVPLLPDFPFGLFVAMSDDKTFHYYRAEKMIGDSLMRAGQNRSF